MKKQKEMWSRLDFDVDIDSGLNLFEEIKELKEEKNAILLAHYYQEDDIQDVADYIGDSLGLAQQAEKLLQTLLFLRAFILWLKQQKFLTQIKKYCYPI